MTAKIVRLMSVSCLAVIIVTAGCNTTTMTSEPARFSKVQPDHFESIVYYPKGDLTESVLMVRVSGPKSVLAGETF